MTPSKKRTLRNTPRQNSHTRRDPQSRRASDPESPAEITPDDNPPTAGVERNADLDGEGDTDLDDLDYDPNARDFLGDFGLDDEEALPEESDFWFDDDEFDS